MTWPNGVSVGHEIKTNVITLDTTSKVYLTPGEARVVAEELLLRADLQDRNDKAYLENCIPRKKVEQGTVK